MSRTPEPGSPDRELSSLLKAWKVDEACPPGFQDAVWRRVDSREARLGGTWTTMVEDCLSVFRQPRMAFTLLAVVLILGGGAGILRGQESARSFDSNLQARYVQSIDPYALLR